MELELLMRPKGEGYTAEVGAPLTMGDVAKLQLPAPPRPALKRITDRHHAFARMIAGGGKPGEVEAYLGYAAGTHARIKDDPSFKELVEFYRSDVQREYRGVAEKLSGIASDALDLIEERLNDPKERPKISIKTAMEVAALGADRTGHGPQSTTNANVNVFTDLASRMAEARRRANETKLIDGNARVVPAA